MLAAVAALVTALVLGACGSAGEFAELEPRALPDSVDSLARADGWEVTDGGVRAQAGDTFELVVPTEEVPAGTDDGQTEIVYHLDRVEADGTVVETVDIVAVTVTAQDTPRETVTLPDDTDAHYKLYAEVTRPDGSFTAYHDWLYAP